MQFLEIIVNLHLDYAGLDSLPLFVPYLGTQRVRSKVTRQELACRVQIEFFLCFGTCRYLYIYIVLSHALDRMSQLREGEKELLKAREDSSNRRGVSFRVHETRAVTNAELMET